MLGLILVGCLPSAETQTDEQKDPFYLTGKTRVNDRDYRGAIESFEKALENNPRNAAAHFELGLLYEQQENDCAAALYHYRVVASNSVGVSLGQDMSFSTLAVPPPLLVAPVLLGNGAFQFVFDNPFGANFTVLAATNLLTPSAGWEPIGTPGPIDDGLYQFADPAASNYAHRYYLLRSP